MITLVLFCLVNVALLPWAGPGDQIENTLAADAARRARADAALSRYGIDFYRRLYPGRSDPEIKQLLYEHSVLRTVYEPFVEFRMPAISYGTLNNHAVGFRILGKDQGPWPPVPDSFNVFVFGGSTTWGGGNLDHETIPAYLQEALRGLAGSAKIALYNFGAGAHFSTQEVTFLQNLLRAGHRPDLVVFIDGLNDFHFWSGESAVAPNLRAAVDRPSHSGLRTSVRALLMALPVTRVLGTWWANLMSRDGAGKVAVDMLRMSGAQADESEDDAIYRSRYRDAAEISDPARIERVIGRYLANRAIARGIANEFGFEAVFVWQPVPLYKYDLRLHPFPVEDEHRRHRYGYPVMAKHVRDHGMGPDFVWCADLAERARSPVYADEVHYIAKFNQEIAECIAAGVKASGALARGWLRKFPNDASPPSRFR